MYSSIGQNSKLIFTHVMYAFELSKAQADTVIMLRSITRGEKLGRPPTPVDWDTVAEISN